MRGLGSLAFAGLLLLVLLSPVQGQQFYNQSTISSGNASWRTVNYDSGFKTAENIRASVDNYSYWQPSAYGNGCDTVAYNTAYIVNGKLATRQNDTGSISWNCYDDAVAQAGNFPWQPANTHCASQLTRPDWVCARNSYGLRAAVQTDFPIRASSNLTFNSRNTPISGIGRYNIFLDLYFWFDRGSQTADQAHGCSAATCTFNWLEVIIRLSSAVWSTSCVCWTNSEPLGSQGTTEADTDFSYHMTVAQVQPRHSFQLVNENVTKLYRDALIAWGFKSTTHAVLLGLEVGTEGYGSVLSVDFQNVKVESLISNPVLADVDFDHSVSIIDVAMVAADFGKCPWNTFHFAWNLAMPASFFRTNAANCIDTFDIGMVALYYMTSY